MSRSVVCWAPVGVLVFAQICYPLVDRGGRAGLVVVTVLLGYVASVAAAALTRGTRAVSALVAVTTGGGFAVEALGVATGVPFGDYAYTSALGPRLAGVPLIIPMAWTWMAWPAWLAAGRLVRDGSGRAGPRLLARIGLAGLGLAAWDLFLDPQMVAEGYWRWAEPRPALPGVPDIPISNYLGWLVVATAMMALLAAVGEAAVRRTPDADDNPMLALYFWTYASSVLAHAVFFELPGSAGWGALVMGLVAVPLALRVLADRRAAER